MALEIKDIRVLKIKEPKKQVLAFVSVTLGLQGGGSVFLHELTIKTGSKGQYVDFPDHKVPAAGEGQEPTYKPYFLVDKDSKKELEAAVLAKFK